MKKGSIVLIGVGLALAGSVAMGKWQGQEEPVQALVDRLFSAPEDVTEQDAHSEFEERMARRRELERLKRERMLQDMREASLRSERWLTAECQFWWQQDDLKSTPRTQAHKREHCGS